MDNSKLVEIAIQGKPFGKKPTKEHFQLARGIYEAIMGQYQQHLERYLKPKFEKGVMRFAFRLKD